MPTTPRRTLTIGLMIPNLITLASLCVGLTAIRFSLVGKWEMAFICIAISFVLDGMDGRLARMLKASSTFGAQLDSLSDFLCFGVAPVVLLYLWEINGVKGFGWGVVLFYAACCAMRLARFNTNIGEDEPSQAWKEKFFTGVPAPVGAGLVLLPLIAYFEFGQIIPVIDALIIANTAFVAVLMASRIPTVSIKKLSIKMEHAAPLMLVAALVITLLTTEPWLTMLGIGGAYYLSIPFSVVAYRRAAKENAPTHTGTAPIPIAAKKK